MEEISELIREIRSAIKNSKLTEDFILSSTMKLSLIGYSYNYDTFPKLKETESFTDESCESPQNLAEALLWKLGKWKSYKKFCNQYSDSNTKPTNSDVVFYAYSQHLKDKENPIYDQHAIRAIWAIYENLSEEEKLKCKSLLMNSKNNWKESGSGRHAVDCYELFLKVIEELTGNGASKETIDRLLMPLGQAIKKNTNTYDEFCKLCGL